MSSFIPPVRATWPDGHRAALSVVVLLDGPGDGSDDSNSIGLDYGPTGLNRILGILRDADVPAALGVTSSAAELYPTIVRQAVETGLEVVPWQADSDISTAVTSLTRIGAPAPQGRIYGLPSNPFSGSDVATNWAITGAGGDFPVNVGQSWLIPTSPYWVDTAWFNPAHPLPPSSLLEAWSLSLADVRAEGAQMTIVLHAHVSGRPGFAGQILRFLDEAIESGDVWLATPGQVAAWSAEQLS